MSTFLDDDMVHAYVTAALWTGYIDPDSADEHAGDPLDAHYDPSDVADDGDTSGIWSAWSACHRFRLALDTGCGAVTLAEVRAAGWDDSQLGHDLWLTRNGHGAGFWDRTARDFPGAEDPDSIERVGKILTSMAAVLGETDLYVSDDGKLRFA